MGRVDAARYAELLEFAPVLTRQDFERFERGELVPIASWREASVRLALAHWSKA